MVSKQEEIRPMTRGEKRLILFLVAALIALWVTFFVVAAWGFEIRTPLGIRIMADDAVKDQFNQHWNTTFEINTPCSDRSRETFIPEDPIDCEPVPINIGPKWKNIQWGRIDDFYKLLRVKYGVYPDPAALVIRIMPLDYSCGDESRAPFNYEFSAYGYLCIDGAYPSTNVIAIHLGDDPGQGWAGPLYNWSTPFCVTALDWELFHYFLKYKGDDCWWNEFDLSCQAKYQGVSELCQ